MVKITWAFSVSLPLSLPDLIASRAASSMTRCEVTPTCLRNLRISMLKTSSFMSGSLSSGRAAA